MALGTYTYVQQTATTLEILNRDTAATVGTISPGLAGLGGIVLSPDGRYMCVPYSTGGTAVIIDLATNAVVLTVTLAGAANVLAVAGWFLITSGSASTSGVWVNTATMTQTAVTFSVAVSTNVHLANGNAYYYSAGTIYQVANGGTSSSTFLSGLLTLTGANFAHDATYLYMVGYRSSNTSNYLHAVTWAGSQASASPLLISLSGDSVSQLTWIPSTGQLVGSTSGGIITFNTPAMSGGLASLGNHTVTATSPGALTAHPTLPLVYYADGSHVGEFNVTTQTQTTVNLAGANNLSIGPSGTRLWASGSAVYEEMTTSPIALNASYTPSAIAPILAVSPVVIAAPSAPTLSTPANASYDDVSAGLTFGPTAYNSTDGFAQNAYALRIKVSGGAYQYWNAGTNALQSTIVWNTDSVAVGGSWSVTLPNTAISNGNIYNWSMASQESGSSLQGAFATDFTFTAMAAPSATVSAPSGTVGGGAQPTIVWSDTLPGSAVQTNYRAVVESGTYGTSPGLGTSAWDSGVIASAVTAVMVGSLLTIGTSYRVFVQVTETGGEVSAWAYSTFTLTGYPPATPTFTATPGNDLTTGAPMVTLTVQANDNQLTANQASLELGTTTGWAAGANTSIAASTTWAQDGAHSLRLTATAGGNVSANTPGGTSGVAVTPGSVVRALASFHSPTTPRACEVAIQFFDAAGSLLSSVTSSTVNSTLTGNGGQAFITTTVPAGAATALLLVAGLALSASEVLYADVIFLGPGTTTTWTTGGLVGTTTVNLIFSDDGVNWFAVRDGTAVAVPVATQQAVVVDYEGALGFNRQYTAQVVAS